MENIEPVKYLKAKSFIDELKRHTDVLTTQQYKTLRGQALHGDIDGARRGMSMIIEKNVERGYTNV